MADLKLYINTSNNSLVGGQSSTQAIDTGSLPLFFGDVLNLVIYLLQTPTGYNSTDPSNSKLETVSIAGLQLFFYLDDGKIGGTVYTSQVAFETDPTDSFFIGTLALNTEPLQTLLGTANSATAWVKVGYVQNGQQVTILSKQVSIGVGIPVAALQVPAGLTPLAAEVANQTYFPQQPVAGKPLYLESPNGKIFVLRVVDDPDGNAHFESSQLNFESSQLN